MSYPPVPIRPIRSAPVRLGPPAHSAIRAIRSHPSAYPPEPIHLFRPAVAIGPTIVCMTHPPPQPVARSAIRAIQPHLSAYPSEPIHLFRPAVAIGPIICLHDPPSASARPPYQPIVQSGRTHPPDPPAPIRLSARTRPPVPASGGDCRMVYLHGLPAVRRGIGTPGKGICPPPEPDNSCRQPHPDLSRTPLRLPVSTTGGTKSAGRRWNEKTGSPGPGRDAAGQEFQ